MAFILEVIFFLERRTTLHPPPICIPHPPLLLCILCILLLSGADGQQATSKTTTPHTASCEEQKDLVFLIDSSLSIRESNPIDGSLDHWTLILDFVKDVVQRLPISYNRIRVGLVPFSTSVDLGKVLPLSAQLDLILSRIEGLDFLGGNTNTSGALRIARGLLSDSGGQATGSKKVMMLITDGLSNVDPQLTLQEARVAKQGGVTIYAIGISEYTNVFELQDVASDPASYYYIAVDEFSRLNLVINDVLDKLVCSTPPPAAPCRDTRADLVFLMDASGSLRFQNRDGTVNDSNWLLLTNFMADIAQSLLIGPDDTRVAAIRFSNDAKVMFHLDTFNTSLDIGRALRAIQIVASTTDTAGALRLMMSDVFTPRRGDRPDVHNVAILITDGQSNVNAWDTIPAAQAAKSAGVRLFVIGVTGEINVRELESMSSLPLVDHFFNRTTYALVPTIVSQLIWSVCHDPCDAEGRCERFNASSLCRPTEKILWVVFKNHLLLGHDYARLTDIASASVCQDVCLQDVRCRSVEYVRVFQQCSVSYFTRSDSPDSFRQDQYTDYYQWICAAKQA